MSGSDRIDAHEKVINYLLDRQAAIDGRMKADLFAMRKLIDLLTASGKLDRARYEALLAEGVTLAREATATDPVVNSLWNAFSERLADLLGDAAPPRPKGS